MSLRVHACNGVWFGEVCVFAGSSGAVDTRELNVRDTVPSIKLGYDFFKGCSLN